MKQGEPQKALRGGIRWTFLEPFGRFCQLLAEKCPDCLKDFWKLTFEYPHEGPGVAGLALLALDRAAGFAPLPLDDGGEIGIYKYTYKNIYMNTYTCVYIYIYIYIYVYICICLTHHTYIGPEPLSLSPSLCLLADPQPVHPQPRKARQVLTLRIAYHRVPGIIAYHQQPEVNYLPRFSPQLISLER